jgi:hypothetical protein
MTTSHEQAIARLMGEALHVWSAKPELGGGCYCGFRSGEGWGDGYYYQCNADGDGYPAHYDHWKGTGLPCTPIHSPSDTSNKTTKQLLKHMAPSIKIALLDNGFVYIGLVSIADNMVVIHHARNIRVWGTTRGLGQIALEGPTAETMLDKTGNVIAPYHALNHLMDVTLDKWPMFAGLQ